MLRITKIRTAHGFSKAELARRARLDQGLVSKIESARVRPYPCELQRLAEALEVPTDEANRLLEQVGAAISSMPGEVSL